LNELLNKILYEVGHLGQNLPVRIVDGKGAKAVGGRNANISLEVSCHPQELHVDPSLPVKEGQS
jgi:hypothetical protein